MLAFGRTLIYVVEIEIEIQSERHLDWLSCFCTARGRVLLCFYNESCPALPGDNHLAPYPARPLVDQTVPELYLLDYC